MGHSAPDVSGRMLYDITPIVRPALAVWPGDTPPSREVLMDMRLGDHLTLSTLRGTVHLGAHADAPSHYGADAPSIEQVSLERYIGPCQVVRVSTTPGTRLGVDAIPASLDAERILFATGSFPDPTRFNEDFVALEPELIERVADAGVRLIGIDTPSVDLFSSNDLPAHRTCLRRDVAIVEGLVLRDVPPGLHELIALPLRLEGFVASPVRAVLRAL
jgi:arylformamidase